MFTEESRPQRVDGCVTALPDGRATIQGNGAVVTVDALTATIWSSLDGVVTLEELAEDLVDVAGGERGERIAQLVAMMHEFETMSLISVPRHYEPVHPAFTTVWPLPEMEDGEVTFDYHLLPYEPTRPVAGNLQSVNLLLASVDDPRAVSAWRSIVDVLRAKLGSSRVVWATKIADGSMAWELYFYRLSTDHAMTFEMICDALSPVVEWKLDALPPAHFGMISIDIAFDDNWSPMPIEQVDVYVTYNAIQVFHSACYVLDGTGLRLKNVYHHYELPGERADFEARLESGAFTGANLDLIHSLVETYASTTTGVFVAVKPRSESIYAGRVTIDELFRFVVDCSFPNSVTRFIETNRGRLDHLRYDIGFDMAYRDGVLVISNALYCGVL